jgi:hypothetical protein
LLPESQQAVLDARDSIQKLIRSWEPVLEISPLGVLPIALRPTRYPLRTLLLRLEQEFARQSLDSMPLSMTVDASVPQVVVGSPSITRRALLDAAAYLIETTGCPVTVYVEAPAPDQLCIRLAIQGSVALLRDPLPPLAVVIGSGRDLVTIRAIVEAMEGTLTFVGPASAPQMITITLPIHMNGQALPEISLAV